MPDSPIRPLFRTLGIAASGLSAQRLRMEVIAMNIANAETTRTEAGDPYRRRMVELRAAADGTFASSLDKANDRVDDLATESAAALGGATATDDVADATKPTTNDRRAEDGRDKLAGVRVAGIVEDMREGPLVYEPGHPDANADGYVRYPNVRVTDEMVDLMDARRIYEANATVFQVTKAMLRRSIDI
ncbi:MAG: flagellar basal body rod protein FlgC [Gemmatimonadaceae bacterium]|nr:flagellar basal body rod protein FlgC [Gemmatimonadaceae bacterium]